MPTDLRDVCPEELVRAAAGCGGLADELSSAAAGLHGAEVPSWVSGPAQGYGHRLLVLERSLRGASTAFDEVASALLEFARVLREVRVLAERARAAAWDAERLHADRMRPPGDPLRDVVLAPEGPAELVLTEQARAWQAEAERLHGMAVLRVVAVLDEWAWRAPAAPDHSRLRRTGTHVWQGLEGPLVGFGRVVESLATSLPGFGTSTTRHEGRQVLEDAGRGLLTPWEAFEELRRELGDHQFGRAAGVVAGDLVLRRAGAHGWKVELFGAHDAMHEEVLRALRRSAPGEAWTSGLAATEWVAERAQAEFLDELGRLRGLPLPGVEQLMKEGANLIQHESYGAHTILKHLGRDADFLRRRRTIDKTVKGEVSTFTDLEEAQTVIGQALKDSAKELRKWLLSSDPVRKVVVKLPAGTSTGLLLDADGNVAEARFCVLRLRRLPGDTVHIVSAYLTSTR